MSSKDEISAIDAIYKLLDEVEEIKRMQINIDNNIKLLNNKFSKFTKEKILSEPEPKKSPMAVVPQSNKTDNIKVFGNIKNQEKTPIENVAINIYNDSGEKIKKTQTNAGGYWSVILSNGKYGVEYIHKNFKPINKTIEIYNVESYEVK